MSDTNKYLSVIAGVGKNLQQFALDAMNGVSFDESFGKISGIDGVSQLRARAAEADALRAERDELRAAVRDDVNRTKAIINDVVVDFSDSDFEKIQGYIESVTEMQRTLKLAQDELIFFRSSFPSAARRWQDILKKKDGN